MYVRVDCVPLALVVTAACAFLLQDRTCLEAASTDIDVMQLSGIEDVPHSMPAVSIVPSELMHHAQIFITPGRAKVLVQSHILTVPEIPSPLL